MLAAVDNAATAAAAALRQIEPRRRVAVHALLDADTNDAIDVTNVFYVFFIQVTFLTFFFIFPTFFYLKNDVKCKYEYAKINEKYS